MYYNVILDTVPEAGSWGSYWVYTWLRGAALGELPASGTVLRIILYVTNVKTRTISNGHIHVLCQSFVINSLGVNTAYMPFIIRFPVYAYTESLQGIMKRAVLFYY